MGAPTDEEKSSPCVNAWRYASYWWSVPLAMFALSVCLYSIGQGWNNPPWEIGVVPRGVEILIFFVIASWIALLEGCQISIVGLQGVNIEPYKKSYPRAYDVCKLAHKGANVERFLVGRQFLLIFNGFLLSRVSGASRTFGNFYDGPLRDDVNLTASLAMGNASETFYMGDLESGNAWIWNVDANDFFWGNSVLLMILIVGPIQLVTQLVAADKMMAFLNLHFYGLYTVLYPCLIMEYVGLTHSAYILKDVLAWAAGIDTSLEDPAKAMNKNALHYLKCLWSVSWVVFGGIFMFKGWAMSQSGATSGKGWENMPGGAAVAVSLLFLFIMALAEGLQVSGLALMKTELSEIKEKSPLAYATCKLMFAGRNMQAFLVGRQFFVAVMMVLLGRVTGYAGGDAPGVLFDKDCNRTAIDEINAAAMEAAGSGEAPYAETICEGDDWGMGKGFNEWILQTGWLGAIFVCNVAQLATQVTASLFPVAFINNRIMNWFLRVLLFTEFTGIVNSCWPLAWGLDAWLDLKEPDFEAEGNYTKGSDKKLGSHMMDRQKSLELAVGGDPLDIYQDISNPEVAALTKRVAELENLVRQQQGGAGGSGYLQVDAPASPTTTITPV